MKSRFLYPLLLIALVVTIGIANYTPGTFLIGWDNVMPEFNLGLNLKRALFAVWQEYRGLGHYDGMAHAANLMHAIYIGALSLFLPTSILRYVFILTTYLVGGLSFFALAKKVIKDDKSAFVGALFYLLNFAVIQLYFAPLEVFAVHFVALPLIALGVTNFLMSPSRKNALLLFAASFLVSPQGFVPTVFIACAVMVGIVGLSGIVGKTTNFKKVAVAMAIFLAANAFWLLPYIYGLPTTSKALQKTRINEFSSPELFERNKARGDIISVLFMKSFMLDTPELDVKKQANVPFMKAWIEYTSNPLYIVGYLGILGVLGYGIYRTRRTRNYQLLPYIAMFGVSFFFLANSTIPFSWITGLLRFTAPTLAEAFRIPFTKFGTLYAFSFAMLLGFGFSEIVKHARLRKVSLLIPIVIILLSFPVFRGQFFSPLLRVEVPQEYFALMNYLEQKPQEKRIALLPAQTFWNWQYRSFGQRGSDFLWYGIKQPILLRAFDPWSETNESFYQELANAINTEDEFLFQSVLKKYNVSYLLLDQYIINNVSSKPINYDRMQRFLEHVTGIAKEKSFGKLELFAVENNSFLTQSPSELLVGTQKATPFDRKDVIYTTVGNYIEKENPDVYFPFASLYTDKLQSDKTFTYKETPQNFTISMILKKIASPFKTITVPSYFDKERLIPVKISIQDQIFSIETVYPIIGINNTLYQIEGERFELPLRGVTNVDMIEIENIKKTSGNSDVTYIENNVINTIVMRSGGLEKQRVYFDTQNIHSEPFRVDSTEKEIGKIALTFPKIMAEDHSNLIEDGRFETKQTADLKHQFLCFPKKNEVIFINKILKLHSTCGTVEASRYIDNLFHNQSYLFVIEADNQRGLPTSFSVDNPFEKRPELETKLSQQNPNVFILPPTQEYYSGYGVHIVSKSLSPTVSRADIKRLSIYHFPLNTVQNIIFQKDKNVQPYGVIKNTALPFSHPAPHRYEITIKEPGVIMLSQKFSDNWVAYTNASGRLQNMFPFLSNQLKGHIMVNGWANGWNANCEPSTVNCKIIIIFWPQYLEYIGFGTVGFILLIILVKREW